MTMQEITTGPAAFGPTGADARARPPFTEYAEAELDFPEEVVRGRRDARVELGEVRRVQEWLTLGGTGTEIDGVFGPHTQTAVRDFQRRHGMERTGKVGAGTWAALTAPMRVALARVAAAEGDTIHEVALEVARAHLVAHPRELTVRGRSNSGPWVRLYMHGREGDDQPWCAGFACHVIAQAAHAMGAEGPPVPRRVGVDALVRDAKWGARFLDGDVLDGTTRARRIPAGALFVVRGKRPDDWTHVGIVTAARRATFLTIEGNTNDEGEREGYEVCARKRRYAGIDFILLA